MEKLLPSQKINQPATPEKNEAFYKELIDLVGDVYAERLAHKDNTGRSELLLKDNLDHLTQVKDNVDFIIEEIKSGRMTDDIIPKENGQAVFDEKLLRTMAILHDVAKIDEEGKLDTFYHHDKNKVSRILSDEASPIKQFLAENNFSPEEVDLMIDGIEKHSRRTDFIARYFDNRGRKEFDLPKPEGVLEYVILSDADILTQSRLEQGVKKIVCDRLANDAFRQDDMADGRHSFKKTLVSVLDSAENVDNAMHFSATKAKAASQYKQVERFAVWLKSNNEIATIDKINNFGDKKKKFDELIVEFLKQAK